MLTSVRNPKVASATRLKKRAFREQDRRFLLEGARGVSEALSAGGGLLSLFAVDELDAVAVRARQVGVDTLVVSTEVMMRLTSTVTPQGLVGVAPFLDVGIDEIPARGCIAVLHEVRDPGNAGTVLRSADAAGASGVVFTSSSVDVYNPKSVRASAGSLFHLPVVREMTTPDVIADLRGRGYRILAMDAAGSEGLYEVDLSGPIAFVFGNEAHGLPADIVELADSSVHVPRAGRAESLNLAAAATVCLFEWARRIGRRSGGGIPLSALIADAAHDLRSPLAAMKGSGSVLQQRWGQMSPEQRDLMLGGIVHDAERMDAMLRQLLDAARVHEGRFEAYPERTDLPALVRRIGQMLSQDPEHPPLVWMGEQIVAFVDPGRLEASLLSLIESAAWWGRTGPVEVTGSVITGRLRLAVSRDGTELSSEGAQDLFLAPRAGSGGGSTIGLFVARSVAEIQQGRAWGEVVDQRLALHLELPSTETSG